MRCQLLSSCFFFCMYDFFSYKRGTWSQFSNTFLHQRDHSTGNCSYCNFNLHHILSVQRTHISCSVSILSYIFASVPPKSCPLMFSVYSKGVVHPLCFFHPHFLILDIRAAPSDDISCNNSARGLQFELILRELIPSLSHSIHTSNPLQLHP